MVIQGITLLYTVMFSLYDLNKLSAKIVNKSAYLHELKQINYITQNWQHLNKINQTYYNHTLEQVLKRILNYTLDKIKIEDSKIVLNYEIIDQASFNVIITYFYKFFLICSNNSIFNSLRFQY